MMFEKKNIDGQPRERVDQIEKHLTIEKPDLPRYRISTVHDEPTRLLVEEIVRGHNEKKSHKAIKKKPKKNSS